MGRLRGSANRSIEHRSVRSLFFLEKAVGDKLRHSIRDFRRPLPNALVEDPPMQDTFDCILGVRLPEKVVQNL